MLSTMYIKELTSILRPFRRNNLFYSINANIKVNFFDRNLRNFSSNDESQNDDVDEYTDLEVEFEEYCDSLKDFVVLDRLSEGKILGSFLSRLSAGRADDYLKKFQRVNLNNLKSLKTHSNALYTFVSCGFYSSTEDLKRRLNLIQNSYFEILSQLKRDGSHNIEPESSVGSINLDDVHKLSNVFATIILACCELGIFNDDKGKVSDLLDSFLFGKLFESTLSFSSGKFLNSLLFLKSTTQFFEKDYDTKVEGIYDKIIRSISQRESDLNISDVFYLKLSTKFILYQNPYLIKKLSNESISFLSNVVFQDYVKEKESHGLEDFLPSKIKEIDSKIEVGVFTIGPFDFTHVSLPNKVHCIFQTVFRNIFFPWQNICVHRTGAFLERNRLALRVPINLTKFEIREYLRKLYDAKVIKVNTLIKIPKIKRDFSSKVPRYYRNGPMYKKAIVTLEHSVPDEVKMLGMDFQLARNPAITKKNVHYGKKSDLSYLPNRKKDPFTGEHEEAWKLPIPNLLADDDWEINPELNENDDSIRMKPDPTQPHVHGGSYTLNRRPDSVPTQQNFVMDLTPWRRKLKKIERSEEMEDFDSEDAKPTPWNFPQTH